MKVELSYIDLESQMKQPSSYVPDPTLDEMKALGIAPRLDLEDAV